MLAAGLSPSMFKRRKPSRAKRLDRKDAPGFLRWLRDLPCACGGRNEFCAGKTEAAHVDNAGKGTPDEKGMGTKVADRFSVPLSRGCHAEQTDRIGWPEFEKLLPTQCGEALSRAYWDRWPGRRAWEADLAASEVL